MALQKMIPVTQDPQWYKDAVIYEVPVKSFCDSNGDGIGDFRGLLHKLDYLERLGGIEYRQKVFEYIDCEDSPRPVTYQLELLRRVGFAHVELLHKNSCFAAFGAWKE